MQGLKPRETRLTTGAGSPMACGGFNSVNAAGGRLPGASSRQPAFYLLSSSFLHIQLVSENEELEELPVTQHRNAVTASRLIPLPEPE